MKLGKEIPELGGLAVTLLTEHLLTELVQSAQIQRDAAEALLAARVILELPSVERDDGSDETLGWLVAARVLHGRRLLIEADENGIHLSLGETEVDDATLRRCLDFDYFILAHAEWKLEFRGEDVEYRLPESSVICLRGTNEMWSRYCPERK